MQDNGDDFISTSNSLKDSGFIADCSTSSLHGTADHLLPQPTSSDDAPGSTATRSATDDWRSLYLKNWVMESSSADRVESRDLVAVRRMSMERPPADEFDDEALMTGRSDESTPEPPTSPRPSVLVRHPRILKDKLHRSMTLLPGLLTAVLEDGDSKSLQSSWNISSTT